MIGQEAPALLSDTPGSGVGFGVGPGVFLGVGGEDDEAWYVYGLATQGVGAPDCPAILPDRPVLAVPVGDVVAWTSPVSRALFDQARAGHRTADPAWMSERVRAAHGVCAAASAAGAFLPLAFGTLFSSLDLLRAWWQPRRVAVRAALDQAARQSEWGLALTADETAHPAWLETHDPVLRDLASAVARASPGTAFLMSRRLSKARAAAAAADLVAVAAEVEAALAPTGLRLTAEPRHGSAGSSASSGRASWTLHAPHAEDGRQADVPAVLAPLAWPLVTRGMSLRLSGPWPAYAFARAVLAEEATHG